MLRRFLVHVRGGVDGFFFSSRRRHTRCLSDWSSDVCSSDLFSMRRQKLAVLATVSPREKWFGMGELEPTAAPATCSDDDGAILGTNLSLQALQIDWKSGV